MMNIKEAHEIKTRMKYVFTQVLNSASANISLPPSLSLFMHICTYLPREVDALLCVLSLSMDRISVRCVFYHFYSLPPMALLQTVSCNHVQLPNVILQCLSKDCCKCLITYWYICHYSTLTIYSISFIHNLHNTYTSQLVPISNQSHPTLYLLRIVELGLASMNQPGMNHIFFQAILCLSYSLRISNSFQYPFYKWPFELISMSS